MFSLIDELDGEALAEQSHQLAPFVLELVAITDYFQKPTPFLPVP
jgi:hypothetical protein